MQTHNLITDFIQQQKLPASFVQVAAKYYVPMAHWIHSQWQGQQARVFGMNGAQGTGKSTLGALLCRVLVEQYGLHAITLSIDDFYLGLAARQKLAQDVHPLLVTRGVPGTHETDLGIKIIDQITQLSNNEEITLPRFIKALDERAPQSDWSIIAGPVDLVIFEGWCVGSQAQSDAELKKPVNQLEALEDPDGIWRRYVNQQLQGDYAQWFQRLDRLILLAAPDFDAAYQWRLQQEKRNARDHPSQKNKIMNPAQLKRFMQHYERLTLANLERLPFSADVVIHLNHKHGVTHAEYAR